MYLLQIIAHICFTTGLFLSCAGINMMLGADDTIAWILTSSGFILLLIANIIDRKILKLY